MDDLKQLSTSSSQSVADDYLRDFHRQFAELSSYLAAYLARGEAIYPTAYHMYANGCHSSLS